MNNSHRLHLSVFLLAVLTSVILFSFDFLGRAEMLYASAVLFMFGELTLLVGNFYRRIAVRTHESKPSASSGMFGKLPK